MSGGQQFPPPPGEAFPISRRGYDPVEVENYLRELDTHLRMVAADRDAAIEQNGQLTRQVNVAWSETDRLKGQLRRLSAPPESVEGMSERLQSMLRLAQDEVSERRKRAEAEAHEIIARAEALAGELPNQNETIRRQLEQERKQLTFERDKILSDARMEADLLRSRATADADRIRSSAAAEAESRRRESDRERQLLDGQSGAKRTQVEEDFNIAMSARRAEAMALLRQRETASRADAAELVARARAESSRTVDEAKKSAEAAIETARGRVAELDGLRARLASELTRLRGVLDGALPPLIVDLDTLERSPSHTSGAGRSPGAPPLAEPHPGEPGSPASSPSNGAVAGPATSARERSRSERSDSGGSHTGPSDSASDRVHHSADNTATTDTATTEPTDHGPTDHGPDRGETRADEPRDAPPDHHSDTGPAPAVDTHAARPTDTTGGSNAGGSNAAGDNGSDDDGKPKPRSSSEFRPSPRRRWPTPAGRQH